MRLAVMQPYVFPYIGYFQLIHAVDTFIFYDDVNYIKSGWINRNRILLNKKDHHLAIPCIKASPNRKINEIEFENSRPEFKNLIKTLEHAYKKAPYFNKIFSLIDNILKTPTNKISILAQQSVLQVTDYLGINTRFQTCSDLFVETKGLDKADRLIELCKKTNSAQYINLIGGVELYDKAYFARHDIQLNFIKSLPIEYRQFNNQFIPWLSIIDVLMFNSPEKANAFLNRYELI